MDTLNAYEAEERLWKEYLEVFRHPPRDFRRGFRPMGAFLADFCVVWHQERLHCFYIDRRLGETECAWPGHEIFLGHASTGDLVNWEVHDPVMLIRPGTWESAHVAAPYILARAGRFIMAYQALNDAGSQDIGLAFSEDLFHWERSPHNPVSPLAQADWAFWRRDGTASCRDSHLNFIDGRYWLSYTACTREGDTCIALASTPDLISWTDHGPILIGGSKRCDDDESGQYHMVHHIESSALIPHHGHWLLFACDWGNINCWESERMDRFEYDQRKCLWQSVGPAELVWEHDGKWLMAACRWEALYDVPGSVLRFAEVDWAVADPEATVITEEADIRAWLDSIREDLP